jgi:3-oxoadipate enol-lactonase
MDINTIKSTIMEHVNKGYNLSIAINGFDLCYEDVGEGETPIIFLHGYPFDKSMWQQQLDYLKSSYRVIACDVRGFGKSTDEKTPLTIDLFADDLIKFMDTLAIDKAIICGLSMGGFIALNAMKRFHSRFEALILCDTQCIADTDAVKEKRHKAMDDMELNGVDAFNEGFIRNVFHPDSLTNKTELVNQLRKVVFANTQHIIKEGLVALAERTETCSSLSEIDIPTLIICGREDAVTPLEQSEFMHDHIKGSKLKVIDKAGHVSNLEQPDEFNKHLLDFLTTILVVDLEQFTEDPMNIK